MKAERSLDQDLRAQMSSTNIDAFFLMALILAFSSRSLGSYHSTFYRFLFHGKRILHIAETRRDSVPT